VTFWHENGQIGGEGTFKNGKLDGNVAEWFENGQIKAEATFKDGKCISGDCSNFK
jgi:antitoxin component YwqK of YwqJK toxin-antitoxin module